MIVKNIEIEMNLTILGESKPYFVKADADIEFEFDADCEPYIELLEVTEAIVIDRYNDDWQFKIVPDKNNSLYIDLLKKIEQAIEEKNGEEFIDDFLMDELDNFNNGGKYE